MGDGEVTGGCERVGVYGVTRFARKGLPVCRGVCLVEPAVMREVAGG